MGTVVVGCSDHFAEAAMLAAGAGEMAEAFRAEGPHGAMYPIPASLLLTMVFLFRASRTFCADAKRMTAGMTAGRLVRRRCLPDRALRHICARPVMAGHFCG